MTFKNDKDARPTSPHLQIYAWNISSLTSILHRFTGVLLYFSIVAISWYVVLYTYKMNGSEGGAIKCDCPLMQILLYSGIIGLTFCLYYHFLNGIRHLFWDIGKGFEINRARQNGYLVLLASLILTAATFIIFAYFKFL